MIGYFSSVDVQPLSSSPSRTIPGIAAHSCHLACGSEIKMMRWCPRVSAWVSEWVSGREWVSECEGVSEWVRGSEWVSECEGVSECMSECEGVSEWVHEWVSVLCECVCVSVCMRERVWRVCERWRDGCVCILLVTYSRIFHCYFVDVSCTRVNIFLQRI